MLNVDTGSGRQTLGLACCAAWFLCAPPSPPRRLPSVPRQAAFWLLRRVPNKRARPGDLPINQSSGNECQQGLSADKGPLRHVIPKTEIGWL